MMSKSKEELDNDRGYSDQELHDVKSRLAKFIAGIARESPANGNAVMDLVGDDLFFQMLRCDRYQKGRDCNKMNS